MVRRRPTTLDDIAEVAGVSRSTVWFVLSDSGRVSDKTRAHVRQVAEDMKYVVNVGARNLRNARAGAIGVYLPESTSGLAYYMDFIFGVIDVASRNEVSVTVLPEGRTKAHQVSHVDGYILVDPPDDDATVLSILNGKLPVVSGERSPSGAPAPDAVVGSDHANGMRELLEHLSTSGAQRPALIVGPANTAWVRDIRHAYLEWCEARDVAPVLADSAERLSADDIRSVTRELLSSDPVPDAIISTPDGSAVGVVSTARSMGIVIGTELLVAGYADGLAMEMADPAITAVDLSPRAFGARCATRLFEVIDSSRDAEFPEEAFPIAVIPRDSTSRRR
ncbi:LacI family DNA-binding transcriptional regulator [Microbacterium sp. C5A9]|uniref:LacI family DNA-binding transcriptional regulator n=1 Tax=Microbacterium sp. C5A9 TaxID=2736663 RepID=UPI001F52079E|nr:LacI family DNA-binding transcriptional regulator [Microbacterium sp. C5A9]MCI1018482.1 LacI family DNA-binding transcriptional regulator [Microbacterium sp. C5A9]